jgi:hypothetical protein
MSEKDWSSVVLMLRDKISSLQEGRNSLADRFNLEVEKAKEYTKAQQEEQRLEFEKDRDTYMKKAGIDMRLGITNPLYGFQLSEVCLIYINWFGHNVSKNISDTDKL